MLIVEDNVDAAETLAAAVGEWGHEVRMAHDGETGIALAQDFRPEVVLLDIGLPRMTGYEVARRLRLLPGMDQALMVAISGYAQPRDRECSAQAGIQLHFSKPIDLALLENLVASGCAPSKKSDMPR